MDKKFMLEPADTTPVPNTLTSLVSISNAASGILRKAGMLAALTELSNHTGGYVQLMPELGFMPALIGKDNEPVFLYQVVEGMDEFLDYDAILAEFPTLSASQIAGAISFLRQVAQINSREIDIDQMEEEFDLQEVRKAFENQGGVARVRPDNH